MLEALIIPGIEFLLQDGRLVRTEHHGVQVLAIVECLVTNGKYRCGHGYHFHIGAGKGHRGDANSIIGDLHVGTVGTGVGDQLQAVGCCAVQRAIDHLNSIADGVGVILVFQGSAVEIGGFHQAERSKLAHCEGVIPYCLQVFTQGNGQRCLFFLDKGVLANVLCAGQVSTGHCGIGKAIVAQILDGSQVFHVLKHCAVGKCTLAQQRSLRIQGHVCQSSTVDKGVLAQFLGCRQIHSVQHLGFLECVVADFLNLAQVNCLQAVAACKGILRNLGDGIIQDHFT